MNDLTRLSRPWPAGRWLSASLRCLCTLLISAAAVAATAATERNRQADQVRVTVEAWRTAWESRDTDAYLALYDPRFASGGRDLAAWGTHKRAVFRTAGDLSVTIDDLQIEVRGKTARARFRQSYRSRRLADVGSKTLLLSRHPAGWRIVREWWLPIEVWPGDESAEALPDTDPAPVVAAIEAWRTAWETRSGAYFDQYGPRFRPAAGTTAAWRASKRAIFASHSDATVTTDHLQVERRGSRARADFHQTYRSDVLTDEGSKTLVLQLAEDGRWGIISETWTPLALWAPPVTRPPAVTGPPAEARPPAETQAPKPPLVATLPGAEAEPPAEEISIPTAEPPADEPLEVAEEIEPDQPPVVSRRWRQNWGMTYAYLVNKKVDDSPRGFGLRLAHSVGDRLALVVDGSLHRGATDRAFVVGGLEYGLGNDGSLRGYVHAVGGLVRMTDLNQIDNSGFCVGLGTGLDISLSQRLGLRLWQVDYLQSFGLEPAFDNGRTYDLRLASGLVVRFP